LIDFLTLVVAPILQLSGLQAQEKQLSQLGDQNVTLKEEMADLKSRSVFLCGLMSPFFIFAKYTGLSVLVHGCYRYQTAESNAFDLFRRQFQGHTVCCWTCIPSKPNVMQSLILGIQDADRHQMHRT